jgi:protein involved in ribonucleotide reduction
VCFLVDILILIPYSDTVEEAESFLIITPTTNTNTTSEPEIFSNETLRFLNETLNVTTIT